MLRKLSVCWCLMLTGFCSAALNAADKTMGKLFIKVADSSVTGRQFADPELASTIVVLERKTEMRSPAGTPVNYRMISANFSVKGGSSWKPACKLTNGSGFNGGASWEASGRVINADEKCAKDNAGK